MKMQHAYLLCKYTSATNFGNKLCAANGLNVLCLHILTELSISNYIAKSERSPRPASAQGLRTLRQAKQAPRAQGVELLW